MNKIGLAPETIFAIDFNLHWVPAALGLEVSPAAAAAMLGISASEFSGYIALAEAQVQRTAAMLLKDPELTRAVDQMVLPVEGLVMTVGDSITTYRFSYARILAAMLAIRRPNDQIRFLNVAQSGYTSTHGLESTFTQFLGYQPDVVFIKFGVNDCKLFGGPQGKLLVSFEEYQANMTGIVDAFLTYSPARPILLTPAPIIEDVVNNNSDFQAMRMSWSNVEIKARADFLRTLAAQRDLAVVDLMELFGVSPNPDFYLPDGLHPGPIGQTLILESVLRVLAE